MYKSKIKITLILMMLSVTCVIFPSIVNAADTDATYTATSTINWVTVNWSYKLNESNEIVELICTNVSDITGDITIPSSIDGKNVENLGNEAFKLATKITGVEIPSTVKEIGLWAFSGCTNLKNIELEEGMTVVPSYLCARTQIAEITIPSTVKK